LGAKNAESGDDPNIIIKKTFYIPGWMTTNIQTKHDHCQH